MLINGIIITKNKLFKTKPSNPFILHHYNYNMLDYNIIYMYLVFLLLLIKLLLKLH